MRKAVFIVLLFCIVCIGISFFIIVDQTVNHLQYNIVEGGVYIQAYSGNDTTLVIPDKIKNYPVVGIDDGAFYARNLTSVILPDSVRYIGEEAFAENPLRTLSMPTQLISIGEGAFSYTLLTHISLPKTIKEIGIGAFSHCSELMTVELPNLTALPERSFFECSSLTDVFLSNNLLTVGDECFYGCVNLNKIILPNNIKEIGREAFSGCTSLESIDLPISLESIGSACFLYCSSLKNVIIPSNITVDLNWNEYLFGKCNDELVLTIKNNTSVENYARIHNIQYIFSPD